MVESTHKAELLAEGGQGLGGFTEDELAVVLGSRKPAPLVEAVFVAWQRHAIRGIERAKAARSLLGNFGTHGVQSG